jgi:hypothetical protein
VDDPAVRVSGFLPSGDASLVQLLANGAGGHAGFGREQRMGHSSSRAALIYLHSTSDRQRTLADAVADRARPELGEASPRGTNGHD